MVVHDGDNDDGDGDNDPDDDDDDEDSDGDSDCAGVKQRFFLQCHSTCCCRCLRIV